MQPAKIVANSSSPIRKLLGDDELAHQMSAQQYGRMCALLDSSFYEEMDFEDFLEQIRLNLTPRPLGIALLTHGGWSEE